MQQICRLAGLVMLAAAAVAASESAHAQRTTAAAAAPAAATPPPARDALAIDARLAGDLARTRLIVDMTQAVDMRVFTLADPYRVVVDVGGLGFRLPASAGRDGRGLITAFRYGQIAPGKARIVLEVREPVAVDKAFVLEALDDQPARLVVDLVRTDRDTFLRTAETQAAPRLEATPATRKTDREPLATRDPKAHLPVVVIDPGHGGVDSGAVAPGGDSEKTIVLAVALILRDRLEKGGRVRVVMTRSEDVFVPLAERVRIARRNEATLFLSIHADSIRAREGIASGASVYTLSEKASDAEAERLAEAENKSELIAGVDLREEPDDVADILIDLAQRETKNFSAHFARTLVSEMRPAARMHRTPLKSAGFKVLKAPDVPSVLLELGFLSNREELRQINSEAWRIRVTAAVAEAVEQVVATRLAAGAGAAPR